MAKKNKLPFLQRLVNSYIWKADRGVNLEDPNQTINGITVAQLFGGKQTKSGIDINEEKALQFSAVWACTRAISDPISFLPPKVYRETASTGAVRVDKNHPINKILQRPNDYTTWNVFISRFITHRTLWGNGVAIINFNAVGGVENLELVHPSNLVDCKRKNGKVSFIIKDEKGNKKEYPYDQVLHLPGFGDDIIGKGVISYAREDLGLELAVQEYGAEFFNEGGKPAGVLNIKGVKDRSQVDQAREGWKTMLQDGGTAVIGGDMQYTPISVPPDDMQFLNTRIFNVNTVARWFGVPPWMIGDLSNGATFNNIEETGLDFQRTTLTPIVSALESEMNYKLFQSRDQGKYKIDFDMSEYNRADVKSQAEMFRTGIQNGYMSPNYVRNKLKLQPVQGGDETFLQSNLLPVSSFTELIRQNSSVSGEDVGPTEMLRKK